MYKLFLVFSMLFTANNCEKPSETTNQEVKTVYIGSALVDCMGLGPQKCMQYKERLDEEWTLFYDAIQGFTHEEGYNYELEVQITPVAEPLQDASSLEYTLIKILKKEKDPEFVENTTQKNAKINAITYEETSRGYQKKISLTAKRIALFKNHETKATATKNCENSDWEQLSQLCNTFVHAEMQEWEAPTQKRLHDGAAHTTITISTGANYYTSNSFGAGAPPAKLEALTNRILELAKSLDKQ